jgi:hypothetical protein
MRNRLDEAIEAGSAALRREKRTPHKRGSENARHDVSHSQSMCAAAKYQTSGKLIKVAKRLTKST